MEDNNSSVYLPEEVVYNILVRLPAIVLYDAMRYVCWRWYNIIASPAFVKAHLDHSTNDLVIQHWNHESHFHFHTIIPMVKDLSLSRLSDRFILDSCDGLVLVDNTGGKFDHIRRPFYIVNPITRQCIRQCFTYSDWPSYADELKLGRSISGVYKLICHYYLLVENRPKVAISVLTLGTGKDDDWRPISLGDESLTKTHGFGYSVTVGGCFYMVMFCCDDDWNRCEKDDHPSGFFILALDLETEMVSQIPAPTSCKVDHKIVSITGGSLSFLAYAMDERELCVWRWLGAASSGEWDMVCKCKIGCCLDQSAYGPSLKALGWVDDGEVLAVRCLTSGDVFTYNVKTGDIIPIANCLFHQYDMLRVIYHVDSLVRL